MLTFCATPTTSLASMDSGCFSLFHIKFGSLFLQPEVPSLAFSSSFPAQFRGGVIFGIGSKKSRPSGRSGRRGAQLRAPPRRQTSNSRPSILQLPLHAGSSRSPWRLPVSRFSLVTSGRIRWQHRFQFLNGPFSWRRWRRSPMLPTPAARRRSFQEDEAHRAPARAAPDRTTRPVTNSNLCPAKLVLDYGARLLEDRRSCGSSFTSALRRQSPFREGRIILVLGVIMTPDMSRQGRRWFWGPVVKFFSEDVVVDAWGSTSTCILRVGKY